MKFIINYDEISSLDVFTYKTEYELFNENLYKKIIYSLNSSIQNLKQLKIQPFRLIVQFWYFTEIRILMTLKILLLLTTGNKDCIIVL